MSTGKGSNPPAEAGIHAGHRQRLRQQYLEHGLDTLHDINVLELILFYAVPRRDTNLMAHHLLDTFGSLSGVFSAPMEELMTRGKLSENAAALIRLIPDAARRDQISRASFGTILTTVEEVGSYMVPFFFGESDEVVYMLGLDAKCKVLGCVRLFAGTVNYANLSVRRVVEAALSMKATSVVLAHNHTSGIAVPSREDIATTRTLYRALDMVGILLADHLIVADGDFVSLSDSGMMGPNRAQDPGQDSGYDLEPEDYYRDIE